MGLGKKAILPIGSPEQPPRFADYEEVITTVNSGQPPLAQAYLHDRLK